MTRAESNSSTLHIDMMLKLVRLVGTLDLDEFLTQMINLTTDTIGASKGSFFLMDESGQELQRFIAARALDPHAKQKVSVQILRSGLAAWVIANEQSALVRDTDDDPRWMTLEDDREKSRVRCVICVPFFAQDHLRGVMTLEHPQPNKFTPDDLRLVEAAASQVGSALHNAQLFDQAQARQQELNAVLNNISEALIMLDSNMRLHLFNPAAAELFGQEYAQQAKGLHLDALAKLTNKPMFEALMQRIGSVDFSNQLNHSFDLEDPLTRKDYAVSVTSITYGRAADLPLTGYVIALHDISSLKDLNRLKTHLIDMAAHDLKNPIGVLRGYLEVIKADTEMGLMPEEEFLENMHKAIKRMEGLVGSMLDIQRTDVPLMTELIEPKALIETVLDDMQLSLALHNHQLAQDLLEPMLSIKGDFARLREVMNNLVENAIKYTPDGGTITLSAASDENRFRFHVADTGYGIPFEQQEHIFQRGFRAQQDSTAHINGTGVGLSLCKEIIERHGGRMWFTSKVGEGSTFGFWVPRLMS
jgi:signal transduction histidine kinase